MFWLSHHPPEEWNRTYRLGGVRVCARCLGTYPVLFAVLGLQLALRAPLAFAAELPVVLLLTLPALLDWARGRFAPERGTNWGRTLTGVLLGLALGRSVYVHLRSPWPPVLRGQLLLIGAVALPVLAMAWRRNRG